MSSIRLPFGRFAVGNLRPAHRAEAPAPAGPRHTRRLALGAVLLASPELQAHLEVREEEHDWDIVALGSILLDVLLASGLPLGALNDLVVLGMALLAAPAPEPTAAPELPPASIGREPFLVRAPPAPDPIPGLTVRGLSYPGWAQAMAPLSKGSQWMHERRLWREAGEVYEAGGFEALAAWAERQDPAHEIVLRVP